MKSINKADGNFKYKFVIDFQKDIKLQITIFILCVISIVSFYIIFFYILKMLGLNNSTNILFYVKTVMSMPRSNKYILFPLIIIVTIIHELIHGLFLYIFTGDKPKLGIKSIYPYAGAPNWYIHKNNSFIVYLSPLMVITIFGFTLLGAIPDSYSSIVFFLVLFNAGGSFGDLWVCIKLLNKPKAAYVNDTGVVISINY